MHMILIIHCQQILLTSLNLAPALLTQNPKSFFILKNIAEKKLEFCKKMTKVMEIGGM